VLLANHGLLTFGKTLREAYSMAEAAENIAKTLYVAKQLGKAADLPEDELKHLRK
jgi:ribulose-5-phosphate 4-epimerase/fuculose-1-phosphate aldolase